MKTSNMRIKCSEDAERPAMTPPRLFLMGCVAVLLCAASAQAEIVVPPPMIVPPLPAGTPVRSVALVRLADDMKDGEPWAELAQGALCAGRYTKYWNSAAFSLKKGPVEERAFKEELTQAGFKVAGDVSNLFEGNGSEGAQLQVGALVKSVKFDMCSKHNWAFLGPGENVEKGKGAMSIEWQIYSPLESRMIARIPTSGGFEVPAWTERGSNLILTNLFNQNVRALMASEAFRTAVIGVGPGVSDLRRPAPNKEIVFAGAAATQRTPTQAAEAVVSIFNGESMGTGFLISKDGYLLTNRHVVGAANYVKVKWPDGVEMIGEVMRSDVGRDIALVKTDPRNHQPLSLRRPAVQQGETVYAIGTPLDERLQGSLTKGVVSAVRALDGYKFIQSDVVVNHGNSGGPLVDEKGQVIGVTVSGVAPNDSPLGINFFIPIGDALDFLNLKPAA
jgi:serine protease Do